MSTGASISILNFKLALVSLLTSSALAYDAYDPHGPYANSLSGVLQGGVTYDDKCLSKRPNLPNEIKVVVVELAEIGRERKSTLDLEEGRFSFNYREAFRDYTLSLHDTKKRFKKYPKTLVPAYRSPKEVQLAFDCE